MELKVELIPDLRTSGGEVQDIMVDGQYAGSLLLVFREGDRVSGSLQIEQNSLPDETEQYIVEQVHEYIRSLADAVSAAEYEVLVSCGTLYSVLQKPESQTDVFIQSSRSEDTYNHDGQNGRADVNEVHVIPGSQAESFTYEDHELCLRWSL
ncbi:hypothetical protein [Paenibacillus taichungensis]|uniref:hypothetical protein n=1 Tax=Paenibacillus taichungensis TaxID=484184 RepID=UPI00399EF403